MVVAEKLLGPLRVYTLRQQKALFFSRLVATFWLRLLRQPARPCLSVPRLRLNKNWIVNHFSWARFCPSCKLWNVIAVVQYTISSRGVGAFADSRQGSFCFYLQIPKSGSFYLLGCTQKPVWLAGSSPEKFVRWRVLQRHPFFYSSNSNTPTWRNSASPDAWIWKHFLPLSVACMPHFSHSLLFSFLHSHVLIKPNMAPPDMARTDSCAGGRGENRPQDTSRVRSS